MRMLFATSLFLVLCVPEARAQVGAPWLIIPTTTVAQDSPVESTARVFHDELWDRGIEVWSLERATSRFEDKASTPPVELSQRSLEEWEMRSKAALVPLASGDYGEAIGQLAGAQELSRRAPEQLNRDPVRARKVLDTCLFLVRALQQTGSASLASGLARECRELVLVGEPDPRTHPPEVLALLAAVDEARAKQTGSILVKSEPSGCDVRVNGVLLGRTPLEVEGLFPSSYKVQVECKPDRPSRVHVVRVRFDRVELLVDPRFDEIVESRPILHLRYPDEAAESEQRLADAQTIAGVLPAAAFLLLHEPQPGVLELDLFRGEAAEPRARVRVESGPEGPTPGNVALATRFLIDGECRDFSNAGLPPLVCKERERALAEPVEPSAKDLRFARRMPHGQLVAGVTLASFGSAALVTGYTLLIPRKNTAEKWIAGLDPTSGASPEQQKWLNLGSGILYTSAGGAAALVAAMPLTLPRYEKPPWWAWLSGGLGVGLAAFSIAYGVTAPSEPSGRCTSDAIENAGAVTCVRRGEHVTLAVLTGVTAAPALTVPLVYLLRKSDKKVEPTLEVSGSRGYFGVRGHF